MMRMRRSQVMALSWFHLVFLDILRVSVKKSREFKVWVSVDTKFWIRLNKLSSELREISGSHSVEYKDDISVMMVAVRTSETSVYFHETTLLLSAFLMTDFMKFPTDREPDTDRRMW
jgi:hypothetical protein